MDAKYGSVNGTAPGLSIVLTKTEGNFTADLLLEKSGQLDVQIRGAKFSYVSGEVSSARGHQMEAYGLEQVME